MTASEQRASAANAALAEATAEGLYRALVSLNGTVQNMVLRRLPDDRLAALEAYATTQPPLPHSNVNNVAYVARREVRRRSGR